MRADFFGDTLVGPTILQWGTEEQKKEFLPQILNGQIRWCQGFSEPDSGSDLASLKTTAVLDGDEWVINGQKVWTTQAQFADYCFLLARTDPDVPKHAGISYLLVPMQQDGVEVRAITQPDGTAEFNEVFFDDARCPEDNVVGGLNNGWAVANTTLGFERGQSATTGYRRFEEEWRLMVDRGPTQRRHRRPAHPPAAGPLPHARSRSSGSTACARSPRPSPARKDPASAALGRHQQDVLVRDAPDAMELALDIFGAGVDARRRRTGVRVLARDAARRAADRLPGQPDDVRLLLQPLRDHLGRHLPDPAQHRRRAGPRPARRSPRHAVVLTLG